jgi:hypothetical protein
VCLRPAGPGQDHAGALVAAALERTLRVTSGRALERAGDLVGLLTSLQPGDVLFVDEIHRLPRVVEEYLYAAMEDLAVDVVIDQDPRRAPCASRSRPSRSWARRRARACRRLPLRFGVLGSCSPIRRDIRAILLLSAGRLACSLPDDAAGVLSERSRGVPRVANRLRCRMRDAAELAGAPAITRDVVERGLTMLGIDALGLEEMDRRLLATLVGLGAGRPACARWPRAGRGGGHARAGVRAAPHPPRLAAARRAAGRSRTPRAATSACTPAPPDCSPHEPRARARWLPLALLAACAVEDSARVVAPTPRPQEGWIDVELAAGAKLPVLSCGSSVRVLDAAGQERLRSTRSRPAASCASPSTPSRSGAATFGEPPVELHPAGSARLAARDTSYRGDLRLEWSGTQRAGRLVNRVALEDYLLGVVPAEMPDRFGLEALKACAVAARSYALASRPARASCTGTRAARPIDGRSGETPLASRAVRETHGELLEHHGRVIKAVPLHLRRQRRARGHHLRRCAAGRAGPRGDLPGLPGLPVLRLGAALRRGRRVQGHGAGRGAAGSAAAPADDFPRAPPRWP